MGPKKRLQSKSRLRSILAIPLGGVDFVDGEGGQAALRVALALVVLGAYAAAQLTGYFGDLAVPLQCIGAYLLFACTWCVVVAAEFGSVRVRLLAVIFLDELSFCLVMWRGGEAMAVIAWLPIFMSLGNGLRFGMRIAMYSAALAAVGLSTVFLVVPYWRAYGAASAGLVLAAIFVPLYGVALARKLDLRRRAAEQRALDAEEATRMDALTRVANRVGFTSALSRVLEESRSTGMAACVFYVDLDGFKAVNDQIGHHAGDKALVDVAEALRGCVRSTDVVGRLGGDEFAIVARGMNDRQDAEILAEKIALSVRAVRLQDARLRLGASIGICTLPHDGISTPQQAIDAADQAMLSVKKRSKIGFEFASLPA
ncbi:GGDEF domain-containing protein [Piscinibacter sp.]|uniref:GGDEF domain-containing protein n=1 Tax=Piscinibacter sp. TaxID=1903157 RepID=UPI0035B345AF